MDTVLDEKLQKVVARAGFGSRRQMESWIQAGRIKVNGKIASLGDRVSSEDKITVDGKKLSANTAKAITQKVLIYNKPIGEICSRNDPEGRPSVFDKLPHLQHARWVAVGRLDINTSGLLLFTTDGELANNLMHPSMQIEREYAVRVIGKVTQEMIQIMHKGVLLEDGLAKFSDIQFFSGKGLNQWYHVVLMEGRNREVRRLWESQGIKVSRLKRVRYGNVFIPSVIKVGQHRELSVNDVKDLYQLADLKYRPAKTSRQRISKNLNKKRK
ncbi:MAG: 23S rRNA pseudouridine(2605) synthase RluB [SAR86 cluster bacterium]|uniref:Pseudouridine synthase n=1 Tax=SAR86 cluster bacterium TaxID=2030880 RepID=A0A2A5CDG4_9GAMM|nr:23S rRNA pseudouridine(2605) synthase RluB [Gammaproteobacteria bacterium AH-315-E17]PCJ41426.1 MAG: 23S rRNA pseudouridine(2605) synthase RluB [SAR86 cluster bacterium]